MEWWMKTLLLCSGWLIQSYVLGDESSLPTAMGGSRLEYPSSHKEHCGTTSNHDSKVCYEDKLEENTQTAFHFSGFSVACKLPGSLPLCGGSISVERKSFCCCENVKCGLYFSCGNRPQYYPINCSHIPSPKTSTRQNNGSTKPPGTTRTTQHAEFTSKADTEISVTTLAGGVIGGAVFGVFITMVTVVMWWKHRKPSPYTSTYSRPSEAAHVNVSESTPVQTMSITGRVDMPGISDRQVNLDVTQNGDTNCGYSYIEITDDDLKGSGHFSLGVSSSLNISTTPRSQSPMNESGTTFPIHSACFSQEKGSKEHETYNKLVLHSETTCPKSATYHRVGDTVAWKTPSICSRQDRYNKFGDHLRASNHLLNAYDRISDTDTVQAGLDSFISEKTTQKLGRQQ